MPITAFELDFKPQTNQFRIAVALQNGQRLTLPIDSIEEYIAVSAMLMRGNAVMSPDGTIAVRG